MRGANAKFERRFGYVERRLREQGRSTRDATLEEMDRLWDEGKKRAMRLTGGYPLRILRFRVHSDLSAYRVPQPRRNPVPVRENKMRKARVVLVLAGVFGVTSVALASPPPWSSSRHVRNDDYDYAPVTRVEPIVRQVRIETPRRECYDDVRYVESPAPQVAAHTLLGGIIGGVIGHQIGHGHGNDFATSRARRSVPASVITAPRAATARRRARKPCSAATCATSTTYEERIDGYRVTYEYNGREYTTRMPYDPGERIKVRVAVAPAE